MKLINLSGAIQLLNKCVALMSKVNKLTVFLGSIALITATCLLTYSAIFRYIFNAPTDWQDEISTFLLVGTMFISNSYVQELRGHIGVEFLEDKLSPKVNKLRHLFIDLFSFLFCLFFTWKTWLMLHETIAEDRVTNSTWGAPLWVPHSLMAIGMTLLTIQLLLQTLTNLASYSTITPRHPERSEGSNK